ncbi:hypothetical protein ACOTB6_24885 [Achromobacter xylosoxidans]
MNWLIQVVKANRAWENVFAAVILVLLASGAGLIALAGLNWAGQYGSGTASWVQAVGSIGAVIAALLVGKGQRSHALALERDARKAKLAAALEVLEQIHRAMSSTATKLKVRSEGELKPMQVYAARRARVLSSALPQFNMIDFSQLPYAYIAKEGLNMRNRLGLFVEGLVQISREELSSGDLQTLLAQINQHARSVEKHLRDVQKTSSQYDGGLEFPARGAS